ncbi:unnamed protein product [Sympodiomycopsis kandeliae]
MAEQSKGTIDLSSSSSAPRTLRIPLSLPRLPEVPNMAALHNLQFHAEKERSKLKLSRMSFFRDAVRVSGSVLPKITPSVLGVTIWASAIFTADFYFDRKWKTSSAIVGPLSVVVGLLLVFRNSTSYDRWYEARKIWAQATGDCRSLARFLWANVDIHAEVEDKKSGASTPQKNYDPSHLTAPPSVYGTAKTQVTASTSKGKNGEEDHDLSEDQLRKRIEKKRKVIRLLILFLYSLAHELRSEPGVDWPDYAGILPDEMRALWESSESATLSNDARWTKWRQEQERLDGIGKKHAYTSETLRTLAPEELEAEAQDINRPGQEADLETGQSSKTKVSTPLQAQTPSSEDWFKGMRRTLSRSRSGTKLGDTERSPLLARQKSDMGRDQSSPPPAMGLPLFALFEIGRYIASARKIGMLNDIGPAGFSLANQLVGSLTIAHASSMRIADCTIPVIYGIHLKQCTMFYLLALPLTLVTELGWKMVPFVTLVAVTLLGLEGISSEVEIPYGDDPSDHNLDLHCAEFKHEIEHMILFLPEGIDSALCC